MRVSYLKPAFALVSSFLLILAVSGCAGLESGGAPAPSPRLAKAQALFDQKQYTSAMIECIGLAREHSDLPGLPELQNRIIVGLTDERANAITLRSSVTRRRMDQDADAHKSVPETYGLRRTVHGATAPLRTYPSAMEQALSRKVTVHLDGVSLNDFILAVGTTENINIIADDTLAGGAAAPGRPGAQPAAAPTITLHAEDVPLSEILDYISRNLGVSIYVGENILWVTPGSSSQTGVPMETRMYRLRKGLSSEELADGSGKIKIIEAIERFVPKEANADLLFDKKSHILIARNSRQNLARVEDIIEALDVCPPQILIEARFISTSISDLSELGIDWILNSPIAVSKKYVIQSGSRTEANKTQIDATAPEAIIGFTPFPNAAQGLNLSYQGLLTDPMFKAVVHALETSGKAATLSVPKVTTVNNRPATMRIGEDFRYFEEYDIQSVPTSVTDAGSQVYSSVLVPVGTPQVEELGIQLDVTPSVGADLSSVNLYIVPEISDFVRYETYEVAARNATGTADTNATSLVKLPIFRRSKIETELIVLSGETVVMGGLISSSENQVESGIPFLSSIPLIGRLFRHDGIETKKQNLLIFVTATILSERGETLIPVSREPPVPTN